MNRMKYLALTPLLTFFLIPLSLASAQNVNVFLVNGSPVRGEFVSSTPESITVKTSNGDVDVSVTNIRNVSITDEPSEMGRARRDFENERFDEGLAELAKVTDKTLGLIAEELAYLKAYGSAMSAIRGGSVTGNDAGKATLDFTNSHPKSYHYFEIVELLGRLLSEIGRFDLAEKEFQKLSTSSIPDIQFRGQYLQGETQLRLGNSPNAEKSFKALLASTQNTADANRLKLLAEPLLAKAMVMNKDVAAAREIVEKIIARENPENAELFASCYNVLGLCHLEEGDLKAAALDFLHTDLLFNVSPELHAEALYYLSTIWPKIQKNDLAFQARETLQRLYRNSTWAQKLNQ